MPSAFLEICPKSVGHPHQIAEVSILIDGICFIFGILAAAFYLVLTRAEYLAKSEDLEHAGLETKSPRIKEIQRKPPCSYQVTIQDQSF